MDASSTTKVHHFEVSTGLEINLKTGKRKNLVLDAQYYSIKKPKNKTSKDRWAVSVSAKTKGAKRKLLGEIDGDTLDTILKYSHRLNRIKCSKPGSLWTYE